jgi:hypothetical protein
MVSYERVTGAKRICLQNLKLGYLRTRLTFLTFSFLSVCSLAIISDTPAARLANTRPGHSCETSLSVLRHERIIALKHRCLLLRRRDSGRLQSTLTGLLGDDL